jgi:hypothetical protein
MRVVARLFVVVALSLGLGPAMAQDAVTKRIALVIGNSSYVTAGWSLPNPVGDAQLMRDRLYAQGFDVDLVKNATAIEMRQAFARYAAKLRSAGTSGVGFFYYAGHGAQSGGENFLLPVDLVARNMPQLRAGSPGLQEMLSEIVAANNAGNFVVIDACRNVPEPFLDGFAGAVGGLADIQLPEVLLSYATAAGTTADDGGGDHSPYTAALAQLLSTRAAMPASLLFQELQIAVRSRTGGAQKAESRNGFTKLPSDWSFGIKQAQTDPRAYEPVLQSLKALADSKPTSAELRTAYAEALLASGRHAEAIAQFWRAGAATTDPIERANFYALLAEKLAYGGDPDKAAALEALRYAEQSQPMPAITLLRASIQLDLPDLAGASRSLQQALAAPTASANQRSQALLLLSRLEARRGNAAAAISNADAALDQLQLEQPAMAYRQACDVRLTFKRVADAARYCIAVPTRDTGDYQGALLREGAYYLVAGTQAAQRAGMQLNWDRAYTAFEKGLALETSSAALQAKLQFGKRIALRCSGLAAVGTAVEAAIPPQLVDDARQYYSGLGIMC